MIENSEQGTISFYPGGSFETDTGVSGTWGYYNGKLTLQGFGSILIKGFDGQRYVGSVIDVQGNSHRVWLTRR